MMNSEILSLWKPFIFWATPILMLAYGCYLTSAAGKLLKQDVWADDHFDMSVAGGFLGTIGTLWLIVDVIVWFGG